MAEKFIANERKLRELIIYIATKCQDDETFGATKLNKLLFLADFLAYGRFGQPITGVEYMKQEQGPVPRKLIPLREEMIELGDITLESREYYDMPNPQVRVIARREADLTLLEKQDISLVDDVIIRMWGQSGTKVSEMTHGYRAWLMARELRDTIPYQAVFLSDEEPTEYELKHAEELVHEYGWDV